MRMFNVFFAALCVLLLSIGCGPTLPEKKARKTTYSQSIVTNSCWVVLEWNGEPYGWGSCFLIDKEKGAFYSNKHVSDMFNSIGRGSHKIFFNGKIYSVRIVQALPLVDAALIKITDPFNPADFPDPSPISTEKPKIGDELLLEGMHVHPYLIREIDKEEGYNFPVIPIFKDYYGIGTRDVDREREVVLEKLNAAVISTDKKVSISSDSLAQGIRNFSNTYIGARTSKNHNFSFGGLSGSPVKNSKLEIIGILTIEEQRTQEVEDLGGGFKLLKKVYDTIDITPIAQVEELRKYLDR
jgi:hypothetical protein